MRKRQMPVNASEENQGFPQRPPFLYWSALSFLSLGEVEPGLDDGVGVEGEALDALFHQPLREVRVIGGALAADPDVLTRFAAGLDRQMQHVLHRGIALV